MTYVVNERLNLQPLLDEFLDEKNREMEMGDTLKCYVLTIHQKWEMVRRKYPRVICDLMIIWIYFWHDFCAKLRQTRHLYHAISGKKHRLYSRVEVLGRMTRAGFLIVNEEKRHNMLVVEAKKVADPVPKRTDNFSPIIRLMRVGKDGKLIKVYKFRTMYSYSEYLQEYVYNLNKLQEGGKLANDFRINFWGRILRPYWLDELPMLLNVLKGNMKWVGVRPLSEHYFSLYTKEMQELRIKVKPGLLPPFYYEKESPKDLDEIQASERRYIEAYLQHPFRTDWRYFWGTIANIIVRRKHSH
jgi:lipopolysaccharide/colanic/teichoic acid biosynthesis glycosyltransferase